MFSHTMAYALFGPVLYFMDYPVCILIALSLLLRFFCLGSSDLLVEEAYYWNYAQHLDFGYLDHPPMVAVLIKASTVLFGTHEWSVRITAMLCWCLTAVFSFKLTNLITRGAGIYAVFLLAILPFFFLQSLVITPDEPLLVCWSGALYCLYRALVLGTARYWFFAGVWLGLGLLSKYTIVLLGFSAIIYLCMVPSARRWFVRPTPYVAVLIAILLFSPVIYWNATHGWISFAFQSTRRINEALSFSFHELLGLLLLFLTPLGVVGLWQLFKKDKSKIYQIDIKSKHFLQIMTLVPLFVFSVFSLTHAIKFNWIGPGLLGIVPWLAMLIKNKPRKGWIITAIILLLSYSGLMVGIIFGVPEAVHQKILNKYIAWEDLTRQVYAMVKKAEIKTHTMPIIIPLDRYNIGSELAFYQAKLYADRAIDETYDVRGSHVFGGESLMYRYWSNDADLSGQTLILISDNPRHFDNPAIKQRVMIQSAVQSLWSKSQGRGQPIRPYYYQVVQMKPASF